MNTRERQFRAELRRRVDVTRMGRPCPAARLRACERRLGQKLPQALRQAYRACDGFEGPEHTGFLRSLAGLVRWNLWCRDEAWLPRWARTVIWFGNDGGGPEWGVDPARPNRILEWDPRWGRYRVAGHDPMEVWLRAQRSWDSVTLQVALEQVATTDPHGLARVAVRIGIPHRTLSSVARGRLDLDPEPAARLSEHLGVKLCALAWPGGGR